MDFKSFFELRFGFMWTFLRTEWQIQILLLLLLLDHYLSALLPDCGWVMVEDYNLYKENILSAYEELCIQCLLHPAAEGHIFKDMSAFNRPR